MSTASAVYWSVRTRAIRKVARDAATAIRTRGWRRTPRGRIRDADPIDVWSALWGADPKKPKGHAAHDVMPNVIARLESLICATTRMRQLHGGKKLIPRWNDAPDRTVGDVLVLLDMMASGKDEAVPFTYRDYTGRLTSC